MDIKLTHSFMFKTPDVVSMLDGVNTMSEFVSALRQQSKVDPLAYDPDKCLGDGLELFVEALIKLSPVDKRIGIRDYQVVEQDDTGVDGYGVGISGRAATVQVKFRSNHETALTANVDHLTNFTSTSVLRYGVDPNSSNHMLVITTAKDIHHFTDDEMLLNKVRCLGMKELKQLVDGNTLFWDMFREAVQREM